jgi:hypothetical protein
MQACPYLPRKVSRKGSFLSPIILIVASLPPFHANVPLSLRVKQHGRALPRTLHGIPYEIQ